MNKKVKINKLVFFRLLLYSQKATFSFLQTQFVSFPSCITPIYLPNIHPPYVSLILFPIKGESLLETTVRDYDCVPSLPLFVPLNVRISIIEHATPHKQIPNNDFLATNFLTEVPWDSENGVRFIPRIISLGSLIREIPCVYTNVQSISSLSSRFDSLLHICSYKCGQKFSSSTLF